VQPLHTKDSHFNHATTTLLVHPWLGSLVVRALGLQHDGLEFDSQPLQLVLR